MMSAFSLAISNIANLKSLEDEICDVLRESSTKPLTCMEILEAIPNPPDRETLTREVFQMAMAGTIIKVGDIPAPPGVPRKTVAVYTLPVQNTAGPPPPRIEHERITGRFPGKRNRTGETHAYST